MRQVYTTIFACPRNFYSYSHRCDYLRTNVYLCAGLVVLHRGIFMIYINNMKKRSLCFAFNGLVHLIVWRKNVFKVDTPPKSRVGKKLMSCSSRETVQYSTPSSNSCVHQDNRFCWFNLGWIGKCFTTYFSTAFEHATLLRGKRASERAGPAADSNDKFSFVQLFGA